MKNILVKNVKNSENKNVTLNGWVYNTRSSGKIGFLMLRDGTGIIQCIVVKNEVKSHVFEQFKKLTQESSITVNGIIVENLKAPGGYELLLKNLKIHQLVEGYPVTPKEHGTEFLMKNRHLWIRSKRQYSILKIRHEIIKATRDFFDMNDFTLVDTPIFTSNACEGTTTLFETEYFGETAYLSQSGQLYGEANALAFGRQYNFGPTFRAEKSKTRRHLTEFWMVEPEIAYCELDGNIEWAEKLINFIIERVINERKLELSILGRDVEDLKRFRGKFPRISYTEAVELLKDGGFDFEWGGDFGSPEETFIAQKFDKPVVVHRFPSAIKAFYMKRDEDNDNVVLGMDILAPEGYGEIVGGAQREDDINLLLKRIEEENLPQNEFEWYLDLRRYGSVPHSGFGMGIERVVAWLCKLPHVRETIAYPRMIQTLRP
jgi:asparaginyl-tRNA synthetase